jgi:RNA polymerase sigma-70 factor (ECF subfamily)
MVMRRCRQLLRDEDQAADAMQETFLRVLRRRADLHATYPSSLLYRIATNTCLNMLRSRKRKPTVGGDVLMESLAAKGDLEEDQLACLTLDQVFLGAKESTRKAAEIHFLEGRTLEETASAVGMSVSGIRKRFRTLQRNGAALMAG